MSDILDRIETAVVSHKNTTGMDATVVVLGVQELAALNGALYPTEMHRHIGQPLDELDLFGCRVVAHLALSLILTK